MAEDKKTFIQGKMNQDIDDRILPNGEYRSAQNIQVTTSEDSDIGSIQNILGNSIVNNPTVKLYDGLETIGCFFDEKKNRIFYFATNYTCPNPGDTGIVAGENGPQTAEQQNDNTLFCGIFVASNAGDTGAPSVKLIAQGLFLNFSKTHLITGVNLLEDLLFFTDGLNQPRKINVVTAENNAPNLSQNILGHYDSENKISVAKFAPFMPPLLLEHETTTLNGNPQATTTDDVGNITNLDPTSSMELSSQNDFPEDFLREKFVRFSYRYRFSDGEYSTIAPFTQICFIPKTTSYSITQLQKVFRKGQLYFQDTSGVADGMVNDVTSINLNIILPSKKITTDFDINAIEILYKESDNNLIRAVELKDLKDADSVDGVFKFKYKSTLPYKTLPQDQLTRVYDNVPLSAKAQEIISNRVVYGNFVENRKLPNQPGVAGLNFSVSTSAKYDTEASFGNADFNNYYLHKEYPFHSIKQRRTYEVGVVLSDKFGRQSPVLTSTLGVSSINVSAKDSSFNSSSWDTGAASDVNSTGGVISSTSPGNENYCGDALTITFNEEIPNAHAKGTFVAINNSALESFVYTNNVYKTFFATDPILQGGPQGGSGIALGTLFYYATNFIPTPGITDFLYLDPTFQTVLTGHNKVYMRSGFNVANNIAQIHEINLNLTTGAVESVSIVSESIFQSDLIGASAPVLVASAGDTVNTTQPTMAVTPIQEPQLNNPYSLGPNSFLLTISNFTQTGVFEIGDYLKGQDIDFVKIIFIDQQGVNGLFFIYTDGPASLLYKNYTGSSDAPVFDLEDVNKYSFYKYNLTPHGWYSYRVVVKQPEQEYYNVYTPGAISFDNDKDENKTYIPIASDSINKITRDKEFTNTQEVGLSTSRNRVYPKVVPAKTSVAEGHTDIDAKALSKQSNADLIDVVSVGTSKEQGLKNENNNVFDFVYESDKNTLMAQLPYGDDNNFIGASVDSGFVGITEGITTTEGDTTSVDYIKLVNSGKILRWKDTNSGSSSYAANFTVGSYLKGENKDLVKIIKFDITANVVTVECDGAIKSLADEGSDIPQALDIKIFQYKYATQNRISVFETKPFESVLDIYYETSTAGLVHELNEAIAFPSTTKKINLLDINFDESVEYFDFLGNWTSEKICRLQLLDQFESELTAGDTPNQIQSCVIDTQVGVMFSGDVVDIGQRFEVILDENDNKFKIKPIGGNFVYFPEVYPTSYNFVIVVTNNNNESETITASLNLQNAAPDTSATPNSFQTLGTLDQPDIFEFNATNGSAGGDEINTLGLVFQDASIGDDYYEELTIGFDVNGDPTSDENLITPLGSGITALRRQILFDENGDPRPEVLINNETGVITLTDLYPGNLAFNVVIKVIDSNDEGLTQNLPAEVGGLFKLHNLFLQVNDGLIVLNGFDFDSNSTIQTINGANVDIFNQNQTNIGTDHIGGSGYNDGEEIFSVFDNYWTSTITQAQRDAGMAEIDIDSAGVFLFSYVKQGVINTSGNNYSSNTLFVAYALIEQSGIPKIVKYQKTIDPTITFNSGFAPENIFKFYINHWLASEATSPYPDNQNDEHNIPGGGIFVTNQANELGGSSGFGSETDIDGRYPQAASSTSSLTKTIEDVDSTADFWDPNGITSVGNFTNAPGFEGHFKVYGDGVNVTSTIAKPNERNAEFNLAAGTVGFLYKTNDTFELGGIIYNILFEIIKNENNSVFAIDHNYSIGKTFLCRIPGE